MATKIVIRIYRLENPVVISNHNKRTFGGYNGEMYYFVSISHIIRNRYVEMTNNSHLYVRNNADLIDLINMYGNYTVRFMRNGTEDGVKVMGKMFKILLWSTNENHMISVNERVYNLIDKMTKDLELVKCH